jgi:hypothetical protein
VSIGSRIALWQRSITVLEHRLIWQARDQLSRPRRLCDDLPNEQPGGQLAQATSMHDVRRRSSLVAPRAATP